MALLTLQKTLKKQCFFNISAFRPNPARTYIHHTCHLMSRGCFAIFFIAFCSSFRPKTAPAHSVIIFPGVPVVILTIQKTFNKNNGFSTIPLFGHTKPEHICIALAISCLEACFATLFICFCSFFDEKLPRPTRLLFSWCPVALLRLQKPFKTNGFLTFPLFGSTKPEHICIMLAISWLKAHLFLFLLVFWSLFSARTNTSQPLSFISNPKGGNRALSIRIRAQ